MPSGNSQFTRWMSIPRGRQHQPQRRRKKTGEEQASPDKTQNKANNSRDLRQQRRNRVSEPASVGVRVATPGRHQTTERTAVILGRESRLVSKDSSETPERNEKGSAATAPCYAGVRQVGSAFQQQVLTRHSKGSKGGGASVMIQGRADHWKRGGKACLQLDRRVVASDEQTAPQSLVTKIPSASVARWKRRLSHAPGRQSPSLQCGRLAPVQQARREGEGGRQISRPKPLTRHLRLFSPNKGGTGFARKRSPPAGGRTAPGGKESSHCTLPASAAGTGHPGVQRHGNHSNGQPSGVETERRKGGRVLKEKKKKKKKAFAALRRLQAVGSVVRSHRVDCGPLLWLLLVLLLCVVRRDSPCPSASLVYFSRPRPNELVRRSDPVDSGPDVCGQVV